VADERAQKDIHAALWGGLERRADTMPMLQVFRLGSSKLPTLAINIKACKDSFKITACLQAYQGLYR
jgi:hypothetical protein